MVINFAAGPAKLPDEVNELYSDVFCLLKCLFLQVLAEVQAELVDYNATGMSVMEMSHRGDTYLKIHEAAIKSVRELL